MRILHHILLRGFAGAARRCLMSLALVAALAAAAVAAAAAGAAASVCVENASIGVPQAALAAGRATAADLVRAGTARIEAHDRAGPHLDAAPELNPGAFAVAAGPTTVAIGTGTEGSTPAADITGAVPYFRDRRDKPGDDSEVRRRIGRTASSMIYDEVNNNINCNSPDAGRAYRLHARA